MGSGTDISMQTSLRGMRGTYSKVCRDNIPTVGGNPSTLFDRVSLNQEQATIHGQFPRGQYSTALGRGNRMRAHPHGMKITWGTRFRCMLCPHDGDGWTLGSRSTSLEFGELGDLHTGTKTLFRVAHLKITPSAFLLGFCGACIELRH